MQHWRRLAATVALALFACGGDGSGPTRWHIELEGLHAAALAVAEAEDGRLWVVGADKRDGRGPLWLTRGPEAEAWEVVSLGAADPEGGHLWWVTTTPGAVWAVGEGGRAFRLGAEGRVARIPTGTTAALYGIWGERDDALWAVGGHVFPAVGPPVIVRVTDGIGTVIPAPTPDWPEEGTLFKVWGASERDVHAVGERGLILRWDGDRWRREAVEGAPRLVTVHGRGDRRVAVGGTSQAVFLERDAEGRWTDRSPRGQPLLSGVYAGAARTCAVGMIGAMFCRGHDGDELDLGRPPISADWHAALIDRRGDLWVVGGNLLSAARMDGGAVLRLGPDRTLGTPPTFPDATPLDAAVDAAGETRGDAELDATTNDAAPDTQPDEVSDAPTEELPEPFDLATDDGPAPDISLDTAADVAEVWSPPPTLPADVQLFVRLDAPEGPTLERLDDGSEVPLVHGPQGGFHVEIVVRARALGEAGVETRLDATLGAWARVEGIEVAGFSPVPVPFWPNGDGTWETTTLLLVFVRDPSGGPATSATFDGKEAYLGLSLETPAGVQVGAVRVRLRDTR
jgi:hypothetical protein